MRIDFKSKMHKTVWSSSCINLTAMRSELEFTNWIIFFGNEKRERDREKKRGDKNVHKRSGLSFGLQVAINSMSRAEVFSMTSRSQMACVTHSWYRAKFDVQKCGFVRHPSNVKCETRWLVWRPESAPSLYRIRSTIASSWTIDANQ